jgi:aspartyl/asparaginyl beta-hydroxylase (cupin superfamily)
MYPNCVPVKAMLVSLIAGEAVLPHRDLSTILEESHRVHLPIVTDPAVMFTVGDETIHMPAGSIYEIDNTRVHGVVNGSSIDRIHLIVDMLPEISMPPTGFNVVPVNSSTLPNGFRF